MVTRRKFSREFKLEAVKLVTQRGVSVAQGTITTAPPCESEEPGSFRPMTFMP